MSTALRPRMGVNKDTQFFTDGLQAGKLLIQHCKSCDQLQHPPGPCCKHCQSFEWDTVSACGEGVLASFVKMHHPALPGFDQPNPVGLITLKEGTRIIAQLIDFDPDAIKVGAAVKLVMTKCDDELTLPLFAPADK
ncbi:Zn-ribbon domain-containing OB-fold protein [Oceanicoccus sp. KOV_DT_Chl]|uniref:Zn-ribbon domain-containing OB-fold protein n=1 Tax=Oceanicoccus sp. KOV_DT_Chl TaxID=1904639 RepID=UPI000C7B9E68|nr:OB-fold domain-containing protein [Oceanicoccus sp. KOV_DT_Chl]